MKKKKVLIMQFVIYRAQNIYKLYTINKKKGYEKYSFYRIINFPDEI